MRNCALSTAVALAALLVVAGPVEASQGLPDPLGPPPPPARTQPVIEPALRTAMAQLAPGRQLRAIVVLKEQADLGEIRPVAPHSRQGDVERALRATAARTQAGLNLLLSQRRSQGLVSDVVPLWITNAVSVRATAAVLEELATRPEVQTLQRDATVHAPSGAEASPSPGTAPVEANISQVNAPALWAEGVRGQGVVVASMDTGVDVTHPDLAGRWRGGSNSWYDPTGQHPTTPTDVSGHGTQTTGLMVGGAAGGTSIGVAPDAQWIAVKVFDDLGSSTTTRIHQGFQWLLDPDGDPATADAPDVVNNSWTLSGGGCDLTFQADLRSLRAAGIAPVFAAGNYGPSAGTVFSPANNPEALSVGGVDDADTLDPSSSRGPSTCSGATSPTVSAPGVAVRTTDLYGGYVDATGTSVAAPQVSGALALLLSALPGLSVDRQQHALVAGAVDLGASGPDTSFGAGRIDALAAYEWLKTSPDFALGLSPSSASTVAGGRTSYSISISSLNGFGGDVTLTLGGLAAEQGSWAFSPAVLLGGSGTARLDVATSASIPPATYPLTVTGTSNGVQRSASASLVVTPQPDFTVTASPSTRTVARGAGTTYALSVGSVNGFADQVTLSLNGLPSSVGAASVSPSVVAGSGSSVLSVTTASSAAPGSYSLTVTATSGAQSHGATVMLVVTAPDFTVSASPASLSVSRGKSASTTVTVSASGGFSESVTLALSGLPDGASASWTGNPVLASGTAQLTIRTSTSTKRGTYTLTVTGSSGALSRQTTITLTVR